VMPHHQFQRIWVVTCDLSTNGVMPHHQFQRTWVVTFDVSTNGVMPRYQFLRKNWLLLYELVMWHHPIGIEVTGYN
jgi:hypothetical protein